MAVKTIPVELTEPEIFMLRQALVVLVDSKNRAANNHRFSDSVRAEFRNESAAAQSLGSRIFSLHR